MYIVESSVHLLMHEDTISYIKVCNNNIVDIII